MFVGNVLCQSIRSDSRVLRVFEMRRVALCLGLAIGRAEEETFAWGWNACGQVGVGHQDDVLRPVSIDAFKGHDVVDVAAGSIHSIAVGMQRAMHSSRALCVHLVYMLVQWLDGFDASV